MARISLLPTQKEISAGEKFLNFCLTFGRYIVIGTQIIVLSCFLVRFKFDRQIEDLSESIEQKQAIVQSFSQQEARIRLLQTQLGEIGKLKTGKKDPTVFFQNLVELLPPTVFLEDLTLKQNKVYLTASAHSSQDLAMFLNKVVLSKDFQQPTLGEVMVDKGNIRFSLSAQLVPKAFQ